jgi:hypothetical protein
MIRNFKRWTAGAILLAVLVAFPGLAQPPRPGSAELPVSRVVLFSSGVGYFQREGQVDGNARIDLQFHSYNINDLLKSLVLQDQGGGQISTVTYDNRDPIDKTLKSFAIDLTSNPSMGQLLQQVRGEKVEVVSYGEQGKQGQPASITGVIVSIQHHKKPVGQGQVADSEQLNLLTSDGLEGVSLDTVQKVRFLKPELEKEFRQALEVLATAHDKQKKTVSLNFLGSGKRGVRVGYVTESPIWKTSYRLSLDKEGKDNKAFLQGWAIVENTTDEDWNNVSMGLVSGRPISFQMDLYEPLYMPRPVVEPELFASLRPQTYSGDMSRPMMGGFGQGGGLGGGLGFQGRQVGGPGGGLGAIGQGLGVGGEPANKTRKKSRGEGKGNQTQQQNQHLRGIYTVESSNAEKDLSFQEGVVSAAVATELGEYFKYELEQPVSLSRQKSALIPIVNGPVETSRVSIYNEEVHAKFPLLGLRFKNTTGLHLMQGPITVFEANTYAGDGHIGDLQPNETRLVSYAVDLGTEVAPETPNPADHLTAVKAYKGVIYATHKVRHTKVYTIKNRSPHERLVLVEHPYRAELSLLKPEKPAERARDVYRFEVKAEPNKPVKLEVVEEEQRVDQLVLSNIDDETVRVFVRGTVSSAKVKTALEEALKLKEQLAQTKGEIAKEEQALQVIEKDQARMRANMERVPQTSEAYKRYLKKFDDQETEIEKRRAVIAKLQEKMEGQRKSYETFIMNLNVE